MATRIARNSLLSAMASLATTLASAVGMVVVARTLGVEQTGIVTLALWLVTMMVTVAGLGLPTAVTRYVAEAPDSSMERAIAMRFLWPTLATAALVLLVAGSAAAALWTGAAERIWAAFGAESMQARIQIWIAIGILGGTQVLGQYRLGVLRGEQDFRLVAVLTTSSFCVQTAATLIGCLTMGVVGALAGYAMGALPMAVSCLHLRGAARRVPGETIVRVRRFAFYTWIGSIMSAFVWARIEIYFLQRAEGYEAVGLFMAGLTLASLATQGPLLLTGALLPHFASAHASGAAERIRETYASATRLIAFLAFPAGLGLAAVMPVAMPMVFGEPFRSAVPLASLLVAVSAIGATSAVGTHLVNALERSDFIFYSSLCGAVLAVTAGLTLVPAFGLAGAGIARALIQIAMVAAGLWFIVCKLGCPAPIRDLGKLFLAATLAALAARGCLHLVEDARALVLAIPVAGVVYLLAVRAMGVLTNTDRERLSGTLSLLPSPIRFFGRSVVLLLRS